jgi:hypothetical protein
MRSAPVATSPFSWLSAVVSAPPVKPKTLTKFAGKVPPPLKKLLRLVATFW